jgi:hypothetical protein
MHSPRSKKARAAAARKEPPLYGIWLVATACGGRGPGCIGDEWVGFEACATPPDAWVPNSPAAQEPKLRDGSPAPRSHPERIALWFSRARAGAECRAFEPERRVLGPRRKDLAERVRLYDGPRTGLRVRDKKGTYVPAEGSRE